MDAESARKEQNLIRVREEAMGWLDKEQMASRFISFHEGNLALLRRDLESSKFVNDHEGYVLTLGKIQAHQTALDAINTASDRAAKANRELKKLEEAQNA